MLNKSVQRSVAVGPSFSGRSSRAHRQRLHRSLSEFLRRRLQVAACLDPAHVARTRMTPGALSTHGAEAPHLNPFSSTRAESRFGLGVGEVQQSLWLALTPEFGSYPPAAQCEASRPLPQALPLACKVTEPRTGNAYGRLKLGTPKRPSSLPAADRTIGAAQEPSNTRGAA